MELILTVAVAGVVLVSGWIPPFIVFYLSNRLAKRTLAEAKEVRADSIKKLNLIRADIEGEVLVFKNRLDVLEKKMDPVLKLKITEQQIADFHEASLSVPIMETKLKNFMSDFAVLQKSFEQNSLTDERLTEIKKDLKKSMQKSIDGKLGAEVKKVKNYIENDPQASAMIEDFNQGGGEVDYGKVLLFRIVNNLVPK